MSASRLRIALSLDLFRNYIYYLIDFGLRILVQLAYFVIISRALGASSYGIFASITAICGFAACFSGLGCEQVLMRRTSGHPVEFPRAFGHALVCVGLTLVPVAAISYGILHLMHVGSVATWAILLFVLAEIAFTKLIVLAQVGYMAQELASRQFIVNIVASAIKLSGAALAWYLASPLTVESWALYYCVSTALGAAFAVTMVILDLGRPRYAFYREEVGDSLQYGLEMATIVAGRDLDKPLVVHTMGPEAGGLYAAAFRVVDTASAPISALLQTTYSRYFRYAKEGHSKAFEFSLRILPISLALSCVISLCLVLLAWIVPIILGPSYENVTPIIQWLALCPIAAALHGAGGDLLRSLGMVKIRLRVVLLSIIVFLPACYLGAVSGGLVGVALARTGTQLFLAGIIWAVLLKARATSTQPTGVPASPPT